MQELITKCGSHDAGVHRVIVCQRPRFLYSKIPEKLNPRQVLHNLLSSPVDVRHRAMHTFGSDDNGGNIYDCPPNLANLTTTYRGLDPCRLEAQKSTSQHKGD